jgi:hypothetical protein
MKPELKTLEVIELLKSQHQWNIERIEVNKKEGREFVAIEYQARADALVTAIDAVERMAGLID